MAIINLNQQLKRVEIKDFEIENEIVFNYFNKIPSEDRDDKLFRALYIGVLALLEDRLASFLAKTSNELGTELESLKLLFEMKKEIFFKTALKGTLAEGEISDFLNNYFENKKLKDKAILTGNSVGSLPGNKTGDIVCEIDGRTDVKISIECKFDKSLKLGDLESKDIFIKKTDTAWSQMLEAQVNREAKVSLIVFDLSLIDNSILKNYDNIGFIPGIGFVAIIDSRRGDYSNLVIAYMLARDIALNTKIVELDVHTLSMIIIRICKNINEVLSIKNLVQSNIENNKEILKRLEKSLLLIQFDKEYLLKFLKDGKLNQKDMFDFYMGEEIKEKYKIIEKEIENNN